MKRFSYKSVLLIAWLCLPLLSPAAPPKTAPKATNSAPSPESFKSVFVMPKTPKEGRDPFFPKATSLYGSAVIPGAQITSVASLKLVGFMGKDLATINNKPFAVGETQEVKTPTGPVTVRLIEIRFEDESVIIEANGQRQELKMGQGKR